MKEEKIHIFTGKSSYSQLIFEEFQGDNRINVIHGLDQEKNILIKKLGKLALSKKINSILEVPFKNVIFRNFLEKIEITSESRDTIIFFDSFEYAKKIQFIKWLKKNYPKLNLYLWNWNSLKIETNIHTFKEIYHKIVTFDKRDARRYELDYFPQLFSKKLGDKYKKEVIYSEGVAFIGADKGRIEILEEIANKLEKLRIPIKFHISKDKGKEYSKNRSVDKYLTEKKLNYNEVLKMIASSDVILDIVQEGQTGFTLRVMESLFLEKKLITKNKEIKKFDFYNPNNILVIESADDIEEDFFKNPYEKVEEETLKKYDVNSWLKHMLE